MKPLPHHTGGGRDLETASKFNKTPKPSSAATAATAATFAATTSTTTVVPTPRSIPYVAVQQTLLQPRRVVVQQAQTSVLMPSTSQNARAQAGVMVASKPLTRLPTVLMPKAQFRVMANPAQPKGPIAQPRALTAQSATAGPPGKLSTQFRWCFFL